MLRYIPLNAGNKPPKGCTLSARPDYWAGAEATPEQRVALIASGNGVGLLTHESGLVIIDCDVSYDVDDGPGGSATLIQRKGIDDLNRAIMFTPDARLTPTRVVRTPSGGMHLYYRQRQNYRVQSRGHRQGWHVDVKASPHTWVVCPPTPGYEVIRDLPIAEISFPLAVLLDTVKRRTRPVGTRRGAGAGTGASTPPAPGSAGYDQWAQTIADWVRESNVVARAAGGRGGAWGDRLFAAARLMEIARMDPGEIERVLIDAAQPWNWHEEEAARRHIANGRAWVHRDKDDEPNVSAMKGGT